MENEKDSMQEGMGSKRIQSARLVFLLFVIVVLGVFWYSSKNNQEKNTEQDQVAFDSVESNRAEITWIDGVVEYKDGEDWKRAEAGTELVEGSSVEILGEGRVIIALDDGSIVRLDKNSSVTLNSLNPENIVLTNEKGVAYTRVVKADRTFTVKVADASYQAMGTAFKTVNSENIQGIEVFQSKVKILGVSQDEILVEEGSAYYLLNTVDKNIEKKITKIDTQILAKDEFLTWNKEEDSKSEEFKDEMGIFVSKEEKSVSAGNSTAVESGSGNISLSAKRVDGGIYLSWSLKNMEAPLGFKIVKSTSPNPVYPGNNYVYLEMPNERNYTWKITDGKTYYFRVCKYLGEKCGEYSNNIVITAPKLASTEDTASVKSIILSGQGTSVNWVVEGSSEQGFKVVWSKSHAPTYPCRESDQYVYYSSSEQKTGKINAFDGSGKYYVRVCEYLGGKCGVYSNEIEVLL